MNLSSERTKCRAGAGVERGVDKWNALSEIILDTNKLLI